MDISPLFVDKVVRIFGQRGREWLPRLPGILAECRSRWDLVEGEPCAVVAMSYVEFTETRDGQPVALKVGVPHEELFTEMAALRLYAGQGAVRLLESSPELGALLMQRVQPGTMLWQVGDDAEQTRIAAAIMRRLAAPPPTSHPFPTFRRWVERAFRLTRKEWDLQERMPRDLIDRAEEAFYTLEREASDHAVLHGDLHHENILFSQAEGWLAIDPKGVIGPRCLEVGRFVQNQLPDVLTGTRWRDLVRQRVAILSTEPGYTQQDVAAAALVDCVLSHCWSFEDGDLTPGWYAGVPLARLLCQMMDADSAPGQSLPSGQKPE